SSGAGFYLLVARKLVVGLRPLRQSKREPRGQLVRNLPSLLAETADAWISG
ncbi:hypothetical protein ACLXBB_21680, partial [Pseudomonas aeruginosa]